MKRINRKQFKKDFLETFNNYKEIFFSSISNKNIIFFVDDEKCEQVTIEFISDKRYLFTIYVNADNKVVNDYITNYFANLPLDKNYVIVDRLNNVETFY